jgi:hypothetical protein
MKVEVNFKCPICSASTPMRFVKPSYIGQAICAVICDGCDCKLKVVIKLNRGAGRKDVTYTAHPEFVSPRAKAIFLQKEAKLKARALAVK